LACSSAMALRRPAASGGVGVWVDSESGGGREGWACKISRMSTLTVERHSSHLLVWDGQH
jgi:hypothetical protein